MERSAILQPTEKNAVEFVPPYAGRVIRIRGTSGVLHYWSKRWIDIRASLLILVTLAPLMLLIALLIVLDSRGPVIFSQERVGSRRLRASGDTVWVTKVFRMHKFRTMVHNADQTLHEEYIKNFVKGDIHESSNETLKFKIADDPRITRDRQRSAPYKPG